MFFVVNFIIASCFFVYVSRRNIDIFHPTYLLVLVWYFNFSIYPLLLRVNEGFVTYYWFDYEESSLLLSIGYSWLILIPSYFLNNRSLLLNKAYSGGIGNSLNIRVEVVSVLTISTVCYLLLEIYERIITGADIATLRAEQLEQVAGSGLSKLVGYFIISFMALLAVVKLKKYFYAIFVLSLILAVLNGSRASLLSLFVIFAWLHKEKINPLRMIWYGIIAFSALATLLIYKVGNETGFGFSGSELLSIITVMFSTFEQAEWLAQSMHVDQTFAPFYPTLESLVFTYLPREFFAIKPIIYGQAVFEYIISDRNVPLVPPTGTFPIGLFTELHMQFSVLSIIIFPLILRVMVRFYLSAVALNTRLSVVYLTSYCLSFGVFVNFSRGLSDTVALFVFLAICALPVVYAALRPCFLINSIPGTQNKLKLLSDGITYRHSTQQA